MNKLIGIYFLLTTNLLFAQQDSTDVLDLNKIYYKNYAIVDNGIWKEGTNNTKIRYNFKNIEDKFEGSSEGKYFFKTGQRQALTGIKMTLGGLGLNIAGASIFVSTLVKNNKFTPGTGIGAAIILGGTVLSIASFDKLIKANNNFEKALWYRNRDTFLGLINDDSKEKLKENYEKNTIYLINNGYVKNGQSRKLGVLGNKIKAEFENIETTNEIFKNFKSYKKIGFALKTLGTTGTISSLLLLKNQHIRNSQYKIFIISYPAILIGNLLIKKSLDYLKIAVFIRNKEIITKNY